jgi:ATP-binding cassette, subfamily B, multidrug efflux pump
VVLSNLFAIYVPVFVRMAIDDAVYLSKYLHLKSQDSLYASMWFPIIGFGIAVLFAAILKGIFMFFMRQTLIVTSRNIEFDQKNEIFLKYEKLGESFYRSHYTGDLMSRIGEDVSNVRMYIGPSIMYFANVLFSFIMVITQMFWINTYLTLWVLLPLPFLSYSIYVVSKKINLGNKRIQEQLSVITTKAQETFAGIRIIKSFGVESQFDQDFKKAGETFKEMNLSLAKLNAVFFPLMTLLMGLSTILILYIGGWEVKAGRFTAGNVAEFIIYLNMLIWPVASLGWTTALVQKASASQKRINEFLNQEEHVIGGSKKLESFESLKVILDHFQYFDKDVPALQHIDVEIKKGQFIGIVGKTGCGKSTLIQILTQQLQPDTAQLFINHEEASNFSLESVRSQMAYVQQDTFLFSDTIKENILFGGNEIAHSENRLQEVVTFASLENDLKEFPNGINTLIGERGVSLSGGQKQRVSLARALMKQADFYFLDDCLSAVDAETEAEIIERLKYALKDKTLVMCSHRIAPIIHADEIWVMHEGKIIDRGSHQKLVETNEYYSWLHENQTLSH